jgi:hypothetical protein
MFRSARPAWSRLRWVRLICAIIASLGLSAIAYLAVSGNSGQASSNSSGSAASTSPVAVGTTARPASAPVSAAGAATSARTAPLTPRHPAQVAAWKTGHGGAALAVVSTQLGHIMMTHDFRQFPDTKQACSKLAFAVKTAWASPPIPDAVMQQSYQAALAALAKAATGCQAAISVRQDGEEDLMVHEDVPMLNRAMSEIASGAKDLYRATDKIKTL